MDDENFQVFKMFYQFNGDAPASSFTEFMGIGTQSDFQHYTHGMVDPTYTPIKINQLSDTNLKTVGGDSPQTYQQYYMDAKTQGETNVFNCCVSFNSNPTYINGLEETVHYFSSFADPMSDYYLDTDTAFIFHVKIRPRGFAKKWVAQDNDYNSYYQWNYIVHDIKVVIMLNEPIPYLEFNNTNLLTDDYVLLEAQDNEEGTLYVNSNMKWSIESETNEQYDVEYSEIEPDEPLYTENSNL